MAAIGHDIDADLQLLEVKIKQAKFEYNQYFMGHRPREPQMLRGEIQKIVAYWSNLPIHNTACRFRFNTLCQRFFSFRRQWDDVIRKIEDGSYEPANRRAKRRTGAPPERATSSSDADVCSAYLEAREACGQAAGGLDRKKVQALLDKQRASIQSRYNCRDVKFRVVVEGGKPKLKATPVR